MNIFWHGVSMNMVICSSILKINQYFVTPVLRIVRTGNGLEILRAHCPAYRMYRIKQNIELKKRVGACGGLYFGLV